jgi:hypothetical protein
MMRRGGMAVGSSSRAPSPRRSAAVRPRRIRLPLQGSQSATVPNIATAHFDNLAKATFVTD